jgi:hypothetical protein
VISEVAELGCALMYVPVPELSQRRRLPVLAIYCLSLLLVGTDVTIVNVALPSIRRDLQVSVSGLQWTIDGSPVRRRRVSSHSWVDALRCCAARTIMPWQATSQVAGKRTRGETFITHAPFAP